MSGLGIPGYVIADFESIPHHILPFSERAMALPVQQLHSIRPPCFDCREESAMVGHHLVRPLLAPLARIEEMAFFYGAPEWLGLRRKFPISHSGATEIRPVMFG